MSGFLDELVEIHSRSPKNPKPAVVSRAYLKKRIEDNVERVTESGCWIWMGLLNPRGYGECFAGSWAAGGRIWRAHRLSYLAYRGPIPSGLDLDHLCRVRCCVNPWHVEPVTTKVNCHRGFNPLGINARKTHCIHGHELAGENLTIRSDGSRICHECKRRSCRLNQRRYRARRRAGVNEHGTAAG